MKVRHANLVDPVTTVGWILGRHKADVVWVERGEALGLRVPQTE